jgi:hypothetical protein
MSALRGWFVRLTNLFRKARLCREFEAELKGHIDMHVADNVLAGLPLDEARRRALIALGGVEPAKERYRERLGFPRVEALWRDVRLGLRTLGKSRGFSAVVVLTLGFAIGLDTTVFTIVGGLFRGLPVERPDRVVWVGRGPGVGSEPGMSFRTAFLTAAQKLAPEFTGMQSVVLSKALTILISGPLGLFLIDAGERVRKFEPLTPPHAWRPEVDIIIGPDQIDAPDIEKVIVQRNGVIVPPLRTALIAREMVTRMGAKSMIHVGSGNSGASIPEILIT